MIPDPSDVELEETVLGELLLSERAVAEVTPLLTADDFYRHTNQHIYRAILELDGNGIPVDQITLADHLRQRNQLEGVGGISYLFALSSMSGSAANCLHHARSLRDVARGRRLVRAGVGIGQLPASGKGIDQQEAEATAILQRALDGTQGLAASTGLDVLHELTASITESTATGQPRLGRSTGFHALDRLTSGMLAGQLWIIAARPSMGKSALTWNIAQHRAEQGDVVAYWTLEMGRRELMVRSMSHYSGIDLQVMERGVIAADQDRYEHAVQRIGGFADRLLIEDRGDLSPNELKLACRRLHRKHKLGLIVVDYLQLMSGKESETRVNQVTEITRALKVIARDLDVPVIACSQLSRAVESRPSRRPILSDLRDSGSVEQDADLVVFLYRSDYYDPDTATPGLCELIIAKHRNGPTGMLELPFRSKTASFVNPPGAVPPTLHGDLPF